MAESPAERGVGAVPRFTAVTWNVLHDVRRTKAGLILPQSARSESQIDRLKDLRAKLGMELGVVAIQEAHFDGVRHNGIEMSRALGYGDGQWLEHNKKPYPESRTGRTGEHVGLFGSLVDHSEPIDIGDHRLAVLSHVGGVAVVNIHTRWDPSFEIQPGQIRTVLGVLSDYDQAMLMGDFNIWAASTAREQIKHAGMSSVFALTGQREPKTWSTKRYAAALHDDVLPPIGGFAAPLVSPYATWDGMYVKGLRAMNAGTFEGESDHYGIWATLESAA